MGSSSPANTTVGTVIRAFSDALGIGESFGNSQMPRSKLARLEKLARTGANSFGSGRQLGDHRRQIWGSAAKSLRAKRSAAPGQPYTPRNAAPPRAFQRRLERSRMWDGEDEQFLHPFGA